jgi:hypothetical protein
MAALDAWGSPVRFANDGDVTAKALVPLRTKIMWSVGFQMASSPKSVDMFPEGLDLDHEGHVFRAGVGLQGQEHTRIGSGRTRAYSAAGAARDGHGLLHGRAHLSRVQQLAGGGVRSGPESPVAEFAPVLSTAVVGVSGTEEPL